MSKTKAVRLSDHEYLQVEKFLKANPMFDFSSLSREAIRQFIENPKVKINPVRPIRRGRDANQY